MLSTDLKIVGRWLLGQERSILRIDWPGSVQRHAGVAPSLTLSEVCALTSALLDNETSLPDDDDDDDDDEGSIFVNTSIRCKLCLFVIQHYR